MEEALRTFRVSHVGGGIPSLDVAKSIAVDVMSYGLWGEGYTIDGEHHRRVDVLLIHDHDGLHAWIKGWLTPACVIVAERRCLACRHVIEEIPL